jgi:capsular exopolysaccharide synthesis family protein
MPATNTLRDYLRVLYARRWIVVGVTLIAVAIGVAFCVLRDPTYESTAVIHFRPQSADIGVFAPGAQVPVDVNPTRSAAADSRIVTRPDVVQDVKTTTKTRLGTGALRDKVEATVEPDSDLIAIKVATGNKVLSARLANAFANATKKVAADIDRRQYASNAEELRATLKSQKQGLQTKAAYRQAIARLSVLSRVADPVEVVRPATVPGSPSSPKPARDIPLAAIVGLILGIAAAFLRNTLDRRLRDRHQIEQELGLPLLAYVHKDTLGHALRNGHGPIADDQLEAFRILRANMAFLAPGRKVTSVVITSAVPEEGKSTVSAWFAYACAAGGRRTLLVDCDLRKPVLSTRFGVAPSPGLSDYLAGEAQPQEILRRVDVQGPRKDSALAFIPAGGRVFSPAETIGSPMFEEFVQMVTSKYDLVIFDSAPLLPVSDTLQLIPRVDAVLLCVRLEQTTRSQAQSAKQALDHLPSKPTGLVISGLRSRDEDYYYGYYSQTPSPTGASAN